MSSEEEDGSAHLEDESSTDYDSDDNDSEEGSSQVGNDNDSEEGSSQVGNHNDSEEIEQQTEVPKPIKFNSVVVDIAFHPKRNLIASGSIDGPVYIHSYTTEDCGNKELFSFDHHKKPCRALQFSESGQYIFAGAQDATICVIDLETNSVFRKFSRPNGASIYSVLPIDNYLMASGEDDGQVVLWDFRMQQPIECFEECEDYISSLVINKDKKILLATSGDGVLTAYNVRAKKLQMRSEDLDVDLLSAGIFKGGTKVAVGAGDGAINIFNWGEFGNISDRFPGHPGSVDSMVVLRDDVICTGCEDGKIRAVQLFPTRFLGIMGGHDGFSVEKLSLSYDSSLLASCSYDQRIKFWDTLGVEDLRNEDVKETKEKHRQLNKQVNDFFADMAES